eukprot:jgi/Mesen1/10500/ME000083S10008
MAAMHNLRLAKPTRNLRVAGEHKGGMPKLAPFLGIVIAMAALYMMAAHRLGTCTSSDERDYQKELRRMGSGATSCPRLPAEATDDEAPVNFTIFSAPKPFEPGGGGRQMQALRSWMRLDPPPQVVLFGDPAELGPVAARFPPGRVRVEGGIDRNFKGTPMFHSMLARARAADTSFSLIINGDIVLVGDFLAALGKVGTRFPSFIMTAMRWDVGAFPFHMANDSASFLDARGEEVPEDDVRAFVRSQGSLHTYGGVDFWAFNNGPVPFQDALMPPFVFGRGRYDNWLLHEAIETNYRAVIDASEAITSIHVAHSYEHLQPQGTGGGPGLLLDGTGGNFWSINKKRNWEAFANIYASRTAGSFTSQMGTALHAPWKLATCDEPAAGNLCLSRRVKPASCRCEYSPSVNTTQSEPKMVGKQIMCGTVVVDNDFYLETLPSGTPVPGLPHLLDQLLPQVADANKTVTLVAVTSRYRELAADFACRMRRLGLANLVVAALDEDCYRYLFTQGLAVYHAPGPAGHAFAYSGAEALAECEHGTPCFLHYRQVKFHAMLEILRAGYNVLWSDVDQVWLSDPFPRVSPSLGRSPLVIQSSVQDLGLAANSVPKSGSDSGGLIYALAHPLVVEAFDAVLYRLTKGKKGKWKGFQLRDRDAHPLYSVLCDDEGLRDESGEGCTLTIGLKVLFLDRKQFASGASTLWNSTSVQLDAKRLGACALENNKVPGGAVGKMKRLIAKNLVQFDSGGRMCLYHWSSRRVSEQQ